MATPLFEIAPAPLPRIRVLECAHLPLRIDALALLTPLAGAVLVGVADERFPLRTGELLVLRGGVPLRLERASADTRIALFQVAPTWLEAFRQLHGEVESAEPRELGLAPAGTSLAHRASQLFAGLRLAGTAGDERVPAATSAALLEVAREAKGSPLDPRHARRAGTRREALIDAIASYDPEASGDFSLTSLAERFGLSERQTARLLRSATGRSFRELKATARLERAQKLLASSDLPILEVALRAGWNSASQFHEAFRSSIGLSPARYRAAHRG